MIDRCLHFICQITLRALRQDLITCLSGGITALLTVMSHNQITILYLCDPLMTEAQKYVGKND